RYRKASPPRGRLLECRVPPGTATMTGRWGPILLLVTALLGASPLSALAASPGSVEIRTRTGSLGRLPRVIGDDGDAFVAAQQLPVLIKGSWSVNGNRATLTVGGRSAAFVRDQSRALVAGQVITLDAATRGGAGGWLISEDFLAKGLPKLLPGAAVTSETR